ncbi:hypothetical protein [Segatella hominis]|jgi:hypothetical protein|uniref:hypothetical protein n=1 Tax=Segatella hominis TaxID=2518605 RepID=UPI003F7F0A09
MRYMLRYGMSVILLVLFAFMGYVLNAIEIDNKVTVDVIMEHDGNLYCYVPNGITMGKHVVVQTTDGKDLSFSFERQQVYKNYTVYVLESDSTMQFPNESDRKISGTVKIGKIKLVNLVFRRWTNLGSLR